MPDVRWDPGVSELGLFFHVIATPAIAVFTVPIAAWFAWRAAGWRGAAFVVAAASGVVLNAFLKVLSGQTPMMQEKVLGDELNFPSGHTVYATALCGALAWLAWSCRRRDIALVLMLVVAGMGPARVSFGSHFVSDVIAGYLVGVAWLLLAATLTLPSRPAASAPSPAHLGTQGAPAE